MSQRAGPNDWELEKLAAGEGTPPPEGKEKLAALQASNEEILRQYPPSRVAAEVQRRLQQPRRSAGWLLWFTVPVMAAAVLLLMPRQPAGGEGVRIKGLEPRLAAFRQTAGQPDPLGAEADARPGDLIQLRYLAAGQHYGAVLSIDGRGTVTLHFPEDATDSTALSAGDTALPHAYQLDDAPAFERFFFVTSDKPLNVAALLADAKKLAAAPDRARHEPLSSVDAAHQTSLLLRKVSP